MSAEAEAFVRTVLRSGLLGREQLQATLRTLPLAARAEARQLADHLIQQGQLTRFQAHKLLQGVSIGLVIGPYQLQAILGRGGMGSVYLAMDTRSKAHVALKVLPPKRAREEERQLARFLREKDLTQKVRHPHLALTLEVGESAGIHYIAMEYIPGQTLYRLVIKEGPLPVPRAARLFAEVAEALAAGHERGVIHRDVKPSNIMVTPHDHAKVLDMGLAFTTGELVEDVEVVGGKGYVVGSIDYMAPEQTRDATRIDGRADVYALGCCLYFAMTGRPPFPAGSLREKVQAHRFQEPEPLRARNPSVPEGFAQVVHRMLAKDPERRFAGATATAVELRLWGGELAPKALETAGDLDYQRAVQDVVAAIPVAEPAYDMVDALIFQHEPDIDRTAIPLSLEPDPWYRYLWLIAIGLGLFWLLATFGVVAALLIRLLLA
jgi:eukaryotic-like serine/threonine-protein kinase